MPVSGHFSGKHMPLQGKPCSASSMLICCNTFAPGWQGLCDLDQLMTKKQSIASQQKRHRGCPSGYEHWHAIVGPDGDDAGVPYSLPASIGEGEALHARNTPVSAEMGDRHSCSFSCPSV